MDGATTSITSCSTDTSTCTKTEPADNALEELALEEILRDIKRGAERAKEHGALGWQKNPAPPPNKIFLRNMLVSTLRDDRPFKEKQQRLQHHHIKHNSVQKEHKPISDPDPPFRYSDPPKTKPDSSEHVNLDMPDSFLAGKFKDDWVEDDSALSKLQRSQVRKKQNKRESSELSLQHYNEWRHSLKRSKLDSTSDSSSSSSSSSSTSYKQHHGRKNDRAKKCKKHRQRKRQEDGHGEYHTNKHKKSKKSKKSKHKSKKSHKRNKD